MTDPTDLRTQLAEAAGAFLTSRPAVLAGEPWPLAATFDHSDEAAWGPLEVLAHVTEMLPYWLGEVERILGAPSPGVPFGRVATDPVRIAIVGRDRTVPLRELYARAESDVARWERRLGELSATDLARMGLHPTRGEMTVAAVTEHMVVSHLAEHAAQLAGLVDPAGGQGS